MKNTPRIATLAAIAAISLYACKKDRDNTTTTTTDVPTRAAFMKLMDDGYKSMIQTASFNAADTAFVYTSPKGTTVKINGTCLRNNGAPVTGQVTMEFFEAFDRADMIVANKPTMGRNNSGGLEPLESGGEFNVSVKQNGVALTTTCGVLISTPANNSGGIKTGMTAFNGIMTDTAFTWVQAQGWDVVPRALSNKYDMLVPGFDWYNCDKYWNDPRPKTKLTINLPQGYANVSSVYLLTKSMPNSLGLAVGDWPIGLEGYIIFVTEKDGLYRWITKEITIVNNHTETFDIANAKTGTRADFNGHVTLLK